MIDEGIAHVGIDGIAIARHLPRQGNADLVPALGVARLGDEGIGVGRTLGRAGDIAKLPHTVERQVAAALRGGPGLGVEGRVLAHRLGGSVGDIGGMGCLLVIADLLGIAEPGDVEARRLVLRIAVGHGGDGGLPAEEGQEGRRDHAVVRIGLTHIGLCLMIVFEKRSCHGRPGRTLVVSEAAWRSGARALTWTGFWGSLTRRMTMALPKKALRWSDLKRSVENWLPLSTPIMSAFSAEK